MMIGAHLFVLLFAGLGVAGSVIAGIYLMVRLNRRPGS
jgi:hypothetical protein